MLQSNIVVGVMILIGISLEFGTFPSCLLLSGDLFHEKIINLNSIVSNI